MAEIILAAIDQKRGAREQAETKLSFFKTTLTYRWLTRFRSMLSSAFRPFDVHHVIAVGIMYHFSIFFWKTKVDLNKTNISRLLSHHGVSLSKR